MDPAPHHDLAEITFLLGTWRGEGEGVWPGAGDFRYGEEMIFEHVGDPFLLYTQRSWSPEDHAPIHLERGFVRPVGLGRVDLVLAHPLGVAEVAEGTVSGSVIDVASTAVALATTGSPVTELHRRIRVEGDTLSYELEMATREVPRRFHLRGVLRRDG